MVLSLDKYMVIGLQKGRQVQREEVRESYMVGREGHGREGGTGVVTELVCDASVVFICTEFGSEWQAGRYLGILAYTWRAYIWCCNHHKERRRAQGHTHQTHTLFLNRSKPHQRLVSVVSVAAS